MILELVNSSSPNSYLSAQRSDPVPLYIPASNAQSEHGNTHFM